jgi:thiol-disulfide isomerase/thioredoxin
MRMDAGDATTQPLHVICLCAEWCGTCRDWRATFEQVAREHPHVRFDWVDIEDEAEAMGEVDVETFPTLLIARGNGPLFLGPLHPSATQLTRLVSGLERGDAPGVAVGPEASPLLARLAACVLSKP